MRWQQYFGMEPFGEERGDLRIAMLTALTANINRDPKKGKAFEPIDFMPFAEKPKVQTDPAIAWAGWKAAIKSLGKTGEKPRRRARAGEIKPVQQRARLRTRQRPT